MLAVKILNRKKLELRLKSKTSVSTFQCGNLLRGAKLSTQVVLFQIEQSSLYNGNYAATNLCQHANGIMLHLRGVRWVCEVSVAAHSTHFVPFWVHEQHTACHRTQHYILGIKRFLQCVTVFLSWAATWASSLRLASTPSARKCVILIMGVNFPVNTVSKKHCWYNQTTSVVGSFYSFVVHDETSPR